MEGYISAGDQFSTVGLSKSTNFIKEYLLREVVTNEDYPMPLVQYEFAKADLIVDAAVNSETLWITWSTSWTATQPS